MDGTSRAKSKSPTPETLARVVYSQDALSDIERVFVFLAEHDPNAATSAARVIREAVEHLQNHPLVGRQITENLRELVISYGKTGYVALYRYLPASDEIRILALRHQRELDYPG